MASPELLSDDDVLNLLSETGKSLTLREIASILGLGHSGRRSLAKIVSRLKRRGRLDELAGGRFWLGQGNRAAGDKGKGSRPQGKSQRRVEALLPSARSANAVPRAQDPNSVVGRLVAHRDGYGFVVPEASRRDIEGDLFIPPDALAQADAMHGDRVLARIERRQGARGAPGRAEGRIVRILDRAHATVVGVFRRGQRGNVVQPYESRILHEIVIPPGQELVPEPRASRAAHPGRGGSAQAPFDGAVVDVALTRFPGNGIAPAGRVIEVLGRPDDFGVDVEIIIRKHHLPHRFPEDVIAEAEAAARPVAGAEIAARRDFRHLPIVTIDGETARDFDDAVYVERRPGGWHLQVHIADVAHYVTRDSALDREARLRGTSVYFPDRAVPMLPEELSNGICSLNPREDRLVQSVLLDLDHDGLVTASEFAVGVIRSAERMTYTGVNRVLEGDAEASVRYAGLAESFRAMRDLALVLNARRTRRGSMDFDLPEPVLTFDPEGRMTGIVRSERNIAHRLIEEFMLAANQAIAQYLERRALPSLHRVHEKPDPKKVLEFEELAHAFGYTLGVAGLSEHLLTVRHGRVAVPGRRDRGSSARQRPMVVALPGPEKFPITPQHYQRLTRKIAGTPEERILSYLMLRSLKQARYAVEPLGHFALAFDEYTHFTSPIRRYPDLIVHRVLKWALAHPDEQAPVAASRTASDQASQSASGRSGLYSHGELAAIALESSEAERRADGAERELIQWKTARFMERHLGEEFDALIVSVQKFGFFVELMELFVEGLVPINILEQETGEPCFYRERDHAMVSGRGSRAHVWELGGHVRVRAERIDPMRHRVEFALVT